MIYTVTRYPDYASDRNAITGIHITDPAVTLYGLTVNSTPDEWDALFRGMDYTVNLFDGSNFHRAQKDGFQFRYKPGMLAISVEVTNREGIIF